MGGRNPEQVLAKAKAAFRSVPFSALTRESMAESAPNPALYALSSQAQLGDINAFLSHSWKDPSEEKWAALEKWAAEFQRTHGGREPTLWIDKFCINQEEIRDSLMCLPVYLAGCQKMLVAVGPTYLERLWCVLELFTFFTMGGNMSDIELIVLDTEEWSRMRVHSKERDRGGVHALRRGTIAVLDPNDKARLLSIVEAGGGIPRLNELIRQLATSTPSSRPRGRAHHQRADGGALLLLRSDVPVLLLSDVLVVVGTSR